MPLYRSDILEPLMETIPLLVADLGTGEILFATRPVEELFGYMVYGELVGKFVEDLIPESIRDGHKALRTEFAEKPTPRLMGRGDVALTGLRRDGRPIALSIGLTPAVIARQRCVIAVMIPRGEVLK